MQSINKGRLAAVCTTAAVIAMSAVVPVAAETATAAENTVATAGAVENTVATAGAVENTVATAAAVENTVATAAADSSKETIEMTAGKATATVQKEISSSDKTFHIEGKGWFVDDPVDGSSTGSGEGALIAIKLRIGDNELANRTTGIITHPKTGKEEPSIWAMFNANADGTFSQDIELPQGLTKGQHFQVVISSGLTGGTQRSATSESLVVDGEQWVNPNGANAVTCTPSVESATLEVGTVDTSARTVQVIGKGWCNATDGASVVAFKLDNGKVSRVENILQDNATIWTILDKDIDPQTGDFDVTMQMPDGTTSGPNGSTPAFEDGAHTLRALTGSLKDGDPGRSVTVSFTMGAYKPPATSPSPLTSSDFTAENRHSLVAGLSGTGDDQQVEVAFPLATPGDWVYMTYYSPDGSQRLVWNDPYQIGEDKIVRLPAKNILESGALTIVAQSGNSDSLDTFVGWAPLNFTTATGESDDNSGSDSGTDGDQPSATSGTENPTGSDAAAENAQHNGQQTVIIVEQPVISTSGAGQSGSTSTPQIAPKPDTEPDAPVEKNWQLGPQNAGDLTTTVDGEKLIITVPNAALGDWFYLWVYSPTPVRGGWVQTDANGTISVDVTAMKTGEFKFALLSSDGSLRGWVPLTLSTGEVATPVSGDAAAVPVAPTTQVAPLVDWRDWALIGGAILVVLAAAGGVMAGRRSTN